MLAYYLTSFISLPDFVAHVICLRNTVFQLLFLIKKKDSSKTKHNKKPLIPAASPWLVRGSALLPSRPRLPYLTHRRLGARTDDCWKGNSPPSGTSQAASNRNSHTKCDIVCKAQAALRDNC